MALRLSADTLAQLTAADTVDCGLMRIVADVSAVLAVLDEAKTGIPVLEPAP